MVTSVNHLVASGPWLSILNKREANTVPVRRHETFSPSMLFAVILFDQCEAQRSHLKIITLIWENMHVSWNEGVKCGCKALHVFKVGNMMKECFHNPVPCSWHSLCWGSHSCPMAYWCGVIRMALQRAMLGHWLHQAWYSLRAPTTLPAASCSPGAAVVQHLPRSPSYHH